MNTNPQNHALPSNIKETVSLSLKEDLGKGDLTAGLIPENTLAEATVICREPAAIAGIAWFNEVFNQLDKSIKIDWSINDGDVIEADTILCRIIGNARNILSGERAALNLLQTLSATATITREYVDLIKHTQCKILDTRKTIPGLRDAQKYAVLCGGGNNHRKGLYDGILIKENHIMAAGAITAAVNQAKQLESGVAIEVEVENLDELREALNAGADIVLLDNMPAETLIQAVEINNHKAKLEASGGISKQNIREMAETGVDFISIGNLTKNIQAIDLSMRFQQKQD